MNLQTITEGGKFRNSFQQRREAKAVESESIDCSEIVIEEKGLVGQGTAREMTEELVREMGRWVWDLGENGESVVEG